MKKCTLNLNLQLLNQSFLAGWIRYNYFKRSSARCCTSHPKQFKLIFSKISLQDLSTHDLMAQERAMCSLAARKITMLLHIVEETVQSITVERRERELSPSRLLKRHLCPRIGKLLCLRFQIVIRLNLVVISEPQLLQQSSPFQ